MPRTKISSVIFDLDGVLVDATEWHYEALNRALDLFGFSISRYDHLATYNGLPTRKKLEMLSTEKGLPAAIHPLLNQLKQIYTKEVILAKCAPIFEKEYMLSRLKQEGFKLAVCSNAIRQNVELMLKQSHIFHYFDIVVSNEDVEHPKPHPETYFKAFSHLNCKPEEAVIIEDAPYGVEAGKRSGGHVCQVSGYLEVDYFLVRAFIERVTQKEAVPA